MIATIFLTRSIIETSDQVFVLLKQWLVGFLPVAWQPAAGVVLSVVAIIGLFPALFAFTTVLERKGLGRIQNRSRWPMASSR
jgi:NADH-quinone oxidoreductase subunit H